MIKERASKPAPISTNSRILIELFITGCWRIVIVFAPISPFD